MKRNILLITTDTQRTDTLGCMGSSFAFSPHLDRMAREGVLFTQAHTVSPACMPARCSLMSGQYPQLHGCVENGISPRASMPFFTQNLKALGYRNIMVGKTHFGDIPDSFDEVYAAKGEKDGVTRDEQSHTDSLICDRAIASMENARQNAAPFFAFCSILSPHSPIDPPGRWANYYRQEDIPDARYHHREWETLPDIIRSICGIPNQAPDRTLDQRFIEAQGNIAENLTDEEICTIKALYYGSAAYCDALVGRLLDYLDQSGLRENTLVIFTSDHGLQNFDHGFNDKHNYYDETLRIPFIMSMPGTLPEGKKYDFASTIDIASSIVAAAGGHYCEGNGLDLFTPLAQGMAPPRNAAISISYQSMAVTTERWKLEYYLTDSLIRLFDRKNDPGELHNLALEEPAVKDKLLRILLEWNAQLIDVAGLKSALHPGGPVARRIAEHAQKLRGDASDLWLKNIIKECNL